MGKSEEQEAAAPVLIDAQVHMESFRQVREARRAELVEDYVELISDLLVDGGEARQVDIAARLGVADRGIREGILRALMATETPSTSAHLRRTGTHR